MTQTAFLFCLCMGVDHSGGRDPMITQGGIIHLAHFRVCSKQRLRLCDGVLKEKVATATQDIFMEGGECREVVLLGL